MTYSQENLSSPGQFIPDRLQQSSQQVANYSRSWNAAAWGEQGWREDVYPVATTPCEQTRNSEPTLIDNKAVWEFATMSDDDCAAAWRAQHTADIDAQLEKYKNIDPDILGAGQDNIQRAVTTRLDLAQTADADLPSFDSDISTRPLSDAYVAGVLAEGQTTVLMDDDNRVAAGDEDAMAPADRADVEAARLANWDAERGVGVPESTPPVRRQRVREPGEQIGRLVLRRVKNSDDFDTPWPALPFGFAADLKREDSRALGLGVYDASGTFLYTPGAFTDKGDGHWYTETPAGQRSTTEDPYFFKLLMGSDPISDLAELAVGTDEVTVRIRWPTNGARRRNRNRRP